MILRSVTKHVTDQNWFAVFVDLLIVVFGVFIGLQVSNLNEKWTDEKQATVFLNRLSDELNAQLISFEGTLEYQKVVREYALTAIDGFNGVDTVNDEQLLISAYQASQITIAGSYRATFDELVSTGKINIIKNEQLKEKIFSYYSSKFSENSVLSELAPYRKNIRRFLPVPIQSAVRQQCGDIVSTDLDISFTEFNVKLPTQCDLNLPDEIFTASAKELRSRKDLFLDLQYQVAVIDTQTISSESFKIQTENLLAALKEVQP